MTGWICPKCGASNAPWVDQCPCSTPPYRILEPYNPQPNITTAYAIGTPNIDHPGITFRNPIRDDYKFWPIDDKKGTKP